MGLFSRTSLVFLALLSTQHFSSACVEEERLALLDFKSSFTIEHQLKGSLSSWTSNDCCEWDGILCSNFGTETRRVTKLDIRNQVYPDSFGYITDVPNRSRATELSSALLKLVYLEHLDLSWNDFSGVSIPSFLGSMKRLTYLNLSNSCFDGLVPRQLGDLSTLEALDLSGGPSEDEYNLFVHDLDWLSGLKSLRRLDLSWVDLGSAGSALDGLSKVLNSLPLLSYLGLKSCGLGDDRGRNSLESLLGDYANSTSLRHFDASINGLRGAIPDVFRRMSSLEVLDLSANRLNSTIPPWIGTDFPSLASLNLGFNFLKGMVPDSLGNLESLEFLDLSYNRLEGSFPSSLWNLCGLKALDFKVNNLTGTLFEHFDSSPLIRCDGKRTLERLSLGSNEFKGPLPVWFGLYLVDLKTLDLGRNSFDGQIPESFGNFSKLEILDLSHNRLNGTVPRSLGKLSMLKVLRLSSNSFQGNMSEAHFENLSMLKEIDIEDNKLLAIQFRPQWVPKFKLIYLNLGSCSLGPQFPNWLRDQNEIVTMYLSNTSIEGAVPRWFSSLKFRFLDLSFNRLKGNLPTFLASKSLYMNLYLSNNRFEGPLPTFPFNLNRLDLTNNLISGPIPSNIGTATPTLDNLLLSGNQITGLIPDSLCRIRTLRVLDLSKNRLFGDIPDCWSGFKILAVLDLSENNLSGFVPSSFGGAIALKSLHLSNNSLRGELPMSLINCANLVVLDLGENRISGTLPKWIGKNLSRLEILRLRSNLLGGEIPLEICRLARLQVLDISDNEVLGTIPTCFGDLEAMASGDVSTSEIGIYRWSTTYGENMFQFMKGKALEYTKTLRLLINMDLSGNRIGGEIPPELTKLVALRGLNLSGNRLVGKIPAGIGAIRRLESLDLSGNELSGSIPQSMASLDSLSHLNLSGNRLSGEIPVGNQLQTLDDPSIYAGNSGLCGAPLPKCDDSEAPDEENEGQGRENRDDDDGLEWLYVSLSAGYVTGLWGVLGVMYFKENWRFTYFRFVDSVKERTSSTIRKMFASFRRSNQNQIDEWRWTTVEELENRR